MEFAEFYESTRDDCLRIVLLNVGDRQLADDLARPHANQSAAIPPPASNPLPHRGGARSKENYYPAATECGAT